MATNECWQHLRSEHVGRLAVNVGDQPDVFPVNYVVDEGTIVIKTAEGTKLAGAIMGGFVAFEVDGTDRERHLGWSVVVHGSATEPRTLPAIIHDEELEVTPWADGEKTRFIQITPTSVTGRRLTPLDARTGVALLTDVERRDNTAQRLFGLALRLKSLDDIPAPAAATVAQVVDGLSKIIDQLQSDSSSQQD